MRAATPRSPGAPPGSRGLSHRDPHPEGGEVRSLLSALHSSARAAPAHPTTLSSPSPLLRSSGPHQLTPVRCPGKSDALYQSIGMRPSHVIRESFIRLSAETLTPPPPPTTLESPPPARGSPPRSPRAAAAPGTCRSSG